MASDDTEGDSRPQTKVGRLIDQYELGEEYGAQLEAAWTGDGAERKSLRDLADEFNRDLLETAMTDAGMAAIDGEVENLFRLLTDDDVDAGARTEARNRLDRNGVDVEQLERDFVTYQAIRSYLKDYRGAEYDNSTDTDRLERTRDSIERLRSRLNSVTESNLDQLRSTDQLTLGDFRVFVSVNVLCEECGSQYSITDLLSRGGCDCPEEP